MAFSSVPQTTEEGRAFLQYRLALFGKSAFLLFLGMSAVGMSILTITVDDAWTHIRMPPYHVAAVLGVGVTWLLCRRGRRSTRLLAFLDAAATTFCGCGIAAALLIGMPNMLPGVPATLTLTHLLIARAIVVPSDPRRTAWIGALAAAPTVSLIVLLGADGLGESGIPTVSVWTKLLPFWCVLSIAVAIWTSHVIYRLRRRVAEARTLGQYTLEDKIGEGGMGVVYRARHAMLRRPTVVKLLPPEKAGDANLQRFEREVQHTSLLTSPNTVAVYDFGRTPDGTFYYAMEFLDGIDLEKLVDESGPQPPGRVIHVLAQACSALAEAHEAGLIHRDIKPSNVMLCRHGGSFDVVKVVDFGLVKDIADGSVARLTQADTLLGTPLYLAPEAMAAPESVSGRSDLYALGAVGYFLLAGRHVFHGRTVAELCSHHLHSSPQPPSRHVAAVPPDLEALVLSCLEKDQERRPASARVLRAALLACADGGRWTDDDARAWWEARHARPTTPVAGALAPTSTAMS